MSTSPSGPTTPGVPTPMPSSGFVARATVARTRASTSAMTSAPEVERAERSLAALEDVAVEVEHGGAEHLVRGEVHADDLQAGAVDVDQRRGLARAYGVGLAELDRLTALEQHGHEVGDGDLGELPAGARGRPGSSAPPV